MPGLEEQQTSSSQLSDTEVGATSSHSHQRTSSFVSSASYMSHHPQFQFEQHYSEYQEKIDQQFSSVKESVLFPDDLVKIIETPKPSNGSRANTVGSISNIPHHIKEQFRYFESPHISIDYVNHGKFEKASLEKLKVRSKELEYEVDKKKPTHALSSSSIDVSASSEETSTSPSTSENNFTKLMKETETTQPESHTPTENLLYNVEDIVDNVEKTSQKIHSNVAYIKNANQKLNKTMFMYDMSTQSVEWDWNGGAEAQICKRMKDKKVPLKHSPIMIELLDFMPKLFTEKFDSEKIEPFFITYCLVDFNTRKRISEEFHCDVNHQLSDESLRKLLTSSDHNVNLSKNRAIFQVSERSPDISLYIRIYKVIQGDEDDAAEPYVRPEKCKDAKSKFFKNVHDNVFKMRPFLQPMAYSFQQMFNENEDLSLNAEISHFLRTKGNMGDDQFFNIYSGSATTPSDSSLGASGTKGKLKTFPASMKLRVIELNSDDYNELKNEIDPIDFTVDIDGTKYDLSEEKLKCHLIREISSSKLNYFHEYDNTLYVYPQTVQIGSRGIIGSKSKSVSVKIELKNNDDNLDAPGLPLIFNRFNKDRDSKTTHDYSTITYHAKHPEFNDEFKIQLPTHITDKHHLLFTFVHVPCKNKESASGKDELPYRANIGNVLGYSFVPLLDFTTPNKQRRKTIEDDTSSMSFNLGKLLSGVEQLPIYQEFSEKKGYTSERVKATSKLMENGKPLFTISFQPFSTIYTTDKSLAHFFASLPLVISDNEVRDSVMIIQRHSTSEPSDLVGSGSGLVSSPSAIMKNIASDDLFDGEMPAIGTNSPLLRSSNSGALLSSMNPEMMVIKYLSEMSHVQVRDLVNFLPSIFNQLLRTICTGMCYNHTMKNAQFQAFQLLLTIIDRVNRYYLETNTSRNQDEERVSSDSSSERNRLIKDYVDKIFVNFHHCDSFVFIELINQWINMLEEAQIRRSKKSEQSKLRMAALENNDDNESKMSLMYSWVLFDLIIKSLTLYLKEKKLLNTSDRSKMFSGGNGRLVEFQNLLLRLVRIMGVETAYRAGAGFNVAKILNSNFALFLRDLFNIMDRGIVLGHIEGYMNIITDRAGTEGNANYEVIQEFRNTFLEIIVDYEFYVNISLPYFYKPGASHNPYDDCEVITDEQRLCSNHYLCGLLMKWCVDDLANKERVVRSRSISLMRNMITKHEYDKRYQNKDVQMAISNMYFAYVLLFIDIFHKFKKASESKLTEIRNIVNKAKNDFQQKLNELSKQQQEQQDQPQPQQLKDLDESVQISKKHYNDTLTQFKDEKERSKLEKQQALITVIFILFNMDRELFLKWFETETFNRKKILLQIVYMSVQVFQYSGRKKIEENHKLGIGAHTNTGKSLNEAKSRLENLYTSLDRRIPNRANPNTGRRNFKDRMNFTTQNRSVRGGQTGSITESSLAAQINKSGTGSISSRSTVSSTTSTGGTTRSNIPFKESEKKIIDDLVLWESRLNVEISSCILSLMLDICKKFQFSSIMDLILNLEINRKRNELEIFHHIFHILMSFFKTNQADCSLIALYHLLRVFVKKFRSTIFTSKNAEYIEVLSKLVLRQSQSVVDRVRAEATALLYWMIKQNYLSDELFNFTRTKIQTTVALSYLASEFENGVNIQLLRESFQIISDYAAADKSVPQLPPQDVKSNQPKVFEIKKPNVEEDDSAYKMPFSQQVKQLVERLRKTLLDTVQIEELKKRKADQESMCDLYHRIAGGYKHAPELSVTWYHNLAQEHIKHERYIEAAECYVYIAGVVFEYLKLRRDKAVWGGQYGSEQKKVNELSQYLLNISPYLRNENFSELRALFQRKPSEVNTEGTVGPEFESHYFNRDGMVQLLYSAIHFCKEDGYYEYMIELHKLLLGLFEIEGNFERMKSVHNELSNLYAKIAEPKTRSARLFGAYYRIYFVGQLFPENVREKEFVYKMPKTTRLNSLMTYLKDHFRFGKELKIIGDSQIITDAMKQEEEAYVQITSVKPYYDAADSVAYEISNSDRYFNENVNISKFIFETPFTKEGKKSHGSITEQCKRKTIIKTKFTFPSVLNRSEVLSKDHTELSPIENSTEIVEMSIQRLATACSGADQVGASEKDEGKNKQVFRFGRILDDDFDVDEEFATEQTVAEATPVNILPVGTDNVTPTSPSDDLVNIEKKKQSAPIDVSQLHLVLTGVVIPSVNEGIPHIVNSFLHPDEVSKYEPHFVKKLKSVCIEFLRSCYRSILISNEYCSDAQRPLHNKFEEGYVTLISVFEQCVDIPTEIREIRKN